MNREDCAYVHGYGLEGELWVEYSELVPTEAEAVRQVEQYQPGGRWMACDEIDWMWESSPDEWTPGTPVDGASLPFWRLLSSEYEEPPPESRERAPVRPRKRAPIHEPGYKRRR